jgi:glycosyltransferase involved in cell wall biosynthesis
LSRSDGLVLTRRDAPSETLSFPTRLVEYLRHGRPVFVSDVGDVSRYLRDGEEVALLHPRDPVWAAATIAAVAARPDRGAELGCRGREAGARAFDRRTHAARLLAFAADLRAGGVS